MPTTRFSRRSFLRFSLIASVSASAPLYIPRHVLGTQSIPPANERIGIGGIGIGRRGLQLFDELPNLGRIVAIADVNLPRAEKTAEPYKAAAYQDYRKLLERKDVDAIITATPDHWRAIVCIHACQAGKDIYAEKPMTLTIHEGRKIVEAVRKYKRVFQTGSQQRSMAANRLGCELVRNGRIGKVHTVIAANYPSPWECNFPGQPVPPGLDWDMWCGPTEPVPYHIDIYTPRARPGWISFRPYSGGEMTGWGAHGLDQIQWALGTDDTGPVEIWTEGPKFNPPTYTQPEPRTRGEKICSEPKVFFKYANGVVVKLDNGPPGGAIFVGDKGRITIDRGKFTVEPKELGDPPYDDFTVHLPVSNHHLLNWLECIKTREKPVAHEEIGHRSTTLCHLGNIARWVGRTLKWDPVNERFVGDDEANQFLDRPRRKPYLLPEV
ncbi:Gfo/Idh/MocA family protein [Thermogutta sp.]|uniref:Gfo/Idh/MocA family protein n=1 Tax=Thermogutta sp. TaxID=1962930 RepID=UPI0032207563